MPSSRCDPDPVLLRERERGERDREMYMCFFEMRPLYYTYMYIYIYIYTYIYTYICTYSMCVYMCIIYIYIYRERERDAYAYIYTYIHTYIRTYVRTYVRTCVRTYVPTCMHACMHACIHTYIHTCTVTNRQSSIGGPAQAQTLGHWLGSKGPLSQTLVKQTMFIGWANKHFNDLHVKLYLETTLDMWAGKPLIVSQLVKRRLLKW